MKKLWIICFLGFLLSAPNLWAGPSIGGGGGSVSDGGGGGSVSDTAYDATSWDGVTDVAPSKNAVRDKFESLAGPPTVQSVTCTDSGNGSHGTLTITPTANPVSGIVNIALTVLDTDGCTVTMSETGAVQDTLVTITNVSAYHADFADQANVLKVIEGSYAMLQNETLTLLYTNSQWNEIASSRSVIKGTLGGFTASRGLVTDGSGNIVVATTTASELGYVNGVTSAIQTQLDAKAPKIAIEVDGHAHIDLTAAQVSNTIIYNTGQQAEDVVLALPTAAAGYSFLATVGTAQSNHFGVQADTNDKIYLLAADGTLSAGNDAAAVVMTAAQIGQSFACWTFKTDAYDWMCKAISIGTSTFVAHAGGTPTVIANQEKSGATNSRDISVYTLGQSFLGEAYPLYSISIYKRNSGTGIVTCRIGTATDMTSTYTEQISVTVSAGEGWYEALSITTPNLSAATWYIACGGTPTGTVELAYEEDAYATYGSTTYYYYYNSAANTFNLDSSVNTRDLNFRIKVTK